MSSHNQTGSLYLVDAHSLIFQVFHAIRNMNSPSGLPTGALFGFSRDLLFLRGLQPDYILCAFDRSEPTFRSDLYADYKAHRDAMPDDLQLQIPLIHQVLQAMKVPVLSNPRYEADDFLATLAQAGAARGLRVYVCTADKDCRQLISDQVCLYNLRKRQEFGRKELFEEWGITPEQVVDLQTLVGDSVDNVPGVPGIGVKTAAKLLQEFGTLDNLIANLDQVQGKKQESIRNTLPHLQITRQLVRLATDVPIDFDWEGWKLQEPDADRLVTLFTEWGFRSLARQFRNSPPSASGPPAPVLVQEELFPFGANEPEEAGQPSAPPALASKRARPGIQGTYHLVDTPKKFEEFLSACRQQRRLAFDIETTSLSPLTAAIVGLSFSWKAGEAWYLPLRGPEGSALLDPEQTLERLRPIFADPAVAKVNQNIKYDLLVLRAHEVKVGGVAGDPMVADYLLHAGDRSHSLADLAFRELKHQVTPITDLIGKRSRKQPQLTMDQVPTYQVAQYAGEDADVAWRLTEKLEAQLERTEGGGESRLRSLYQDLEVPLIEVLAELEFNGIRLDVSLLQRLSKEMAQELARIEEEIFQLAGHRFHIGSLPQLRTVLFEELKLPVQGRTGVTGVPSTDQETLEKLAALALPGSNLPRKILEHRQLAKLKSTYLDALPAMVIPRTGRIHASFNQTVTSTGRLSASDPNLQNIPVRKERGQQIRQAFIPEPGWFLLTADYSQIELRLLAHFCGDEELRRAFAEEQDIHAIVAAQVFAVPLEEVSAEQRRMAKTVNFGVIYGMSPGGLSQRLSIPREEAERFIASYFARYPRVEQYQSQLLRDCRKTRHVATILGRRRYFDPKAIRPDSTFRQRNQAEREAINMQVQGSAADLMKLAMLNVYRRLHREKCQARLLLQIHDELVFEAPPEEMSVLVSLVQEEMTTPVARRLGLEVPLVVDLACGPNWLDVSAISPRSRLPPLANA
jgi:DNA polymerase-1